MTLFLIANIFTCICAYVGFIFGIAKFFKPKKAVYAQMITLAVGCMAFGRLYQVVRLITVGDIFQRFQLGLLGVIGSLMFLFSANYGVMDSLADDKSKQFTKYRIIPLIAPVIAAAFYVIFYLFKDYEAFIKIIAAVITVFVMFGSYFNLKHLIFPDVDFGVINCLKEYNALALIYEFLCLIELVAYGRESGIFALIIAVLMGVVILLIVPTVERGIKKWST